MPRSLHKPPSLRQAAMARFPEAEKRLLIKKICMKCHARNALRATRCRKCGSSELRPKAKEARRE